MLATGRGTSRGETPAEDLLFDIEADLFGEEEIYPDLGAWRRSLRLRFPPCQARANAYTGAVDNNIRDTHLQLRLQGHPFAQAWKGGMLSSFFII